jgi:hypothetical protein
MEVINSLLWIVNHGYKKDKKAIGEEYTRYAAVTPAFNPWGRRTTPKKLARSQGSHHDP